MKADHRAPRVLADSALNAVDPLWFWPQSFGQWLSTRWPVVIAAYKRGEPITAMSLDQLMLRDGEHDFLLWIPASTQYDIVVFDSAGLVPVQTDGDADLLLVRLDR